MLAGQHRVESLLHQLLAGSGNRGDAGVQGEGDLAITPPFAGLRRVGFQQDARPHQLARAVFALMDQRVELFALLVVERYDVLLYGSSLRSHDASPSLRRHRFREPMQNQRRGVLGLFR
jgi:hypothetical protein